MHTSGVEGRQRVRVYLRSRLTPQCGLRLPVSPHPIQLLLLLHLLLFINFLISTKTFLSPRIPFNSSSFSSIFFYLSPYFHQSLPVSHSTHLLLLHRLLIYLLHLLLIHPLFIHLLPSSTTSSAKLSCLYSTVLPSSSLSPPPSQMYLSPQYPL